jgi:hypothetical protein
MDKTWMDVKEVTLDHTDEFWPTCFKVRVLMKLPILTWTLNPHLNVPQENQSTTVELLLKLSWKIITAVKIN